MIELLLATIFFLLTPFFSHPASTPPSLVDRPCLRLKVYVRPTNESLFESPEPIFTSNNCSRCLHISQLGLVLALIWNLL
ncbi:hypothetical protein NDU88_006541 [Pleurodeles waltl]|uniref:Secreted protein n=1 Tax=Pleurodeles waltl TaxID=8319 RepID=A0AAV7L5N2_PLEWA|nr:hypothetical protein NDU88_006541 [Pleurodeles waltl]